jgi:hypothetical protein
MKSKKLNGTKTHTAENHNSKALPSWLLIMIFGTWILTTLTGLWWFQSTKVKSFIDIQDDVTFFQAHSIDNLLQPYLKKAGGAPENQKTLLHFWRPDCLCNRISQRHFSDLTSQYSSEQLRIIIIAHPSSSDYDIEELLRLNSDRFMVIRADDSLLSLPSSPSLAIYDDQGEFNYFGPYGFGAFCTVRDDGFLSSIIDNPKPGRFTNVIGDGCFCSWSD